MAKLTAHINLFIRIYDDDDVNGEMKKKSQTHKNQTWLTYSFIS